MPIGWPAASPNKKSLLFGKGGGFVIIISTNADPVSLNLCLLAGGISYDEIARLREEHLVDIVQPLDRQRPSKSAGLCNGERHVSDTHSPLIFVAFYPTDWLAGTRGMTPAETGVYITLIAMMYEQGRLLPFDQPQLARLCNCSAGTFKKVIARLITQDKIIKTPQGLWNKRVEAELHKARNAIDQRRERGKKGAHARWAKVEGLSAQPENVLAELESEGKERDPYSYENYSEINANAMHEQCSTNAIQIQSQIDKESSSAHEPSLGYKNKARTSQEDVNSTISRLIDALGYGSSHCPSGWVTPDAGLLVASWEIELDLTADEIVSVATASAEAHGSPARYPSILTDAMRRHAGQKQALPLTPLMPSSKIKATSPTLQGHSIIPQLPEKFR